MNQSISISSDALIQYYYAMKGHLGEHRMDQLRHQMELQYGGIVFDGMRVLEIGDGSGIHAFYAAASGANDVLSS